MTEPFDGARFVGEIVAVLARALDRVAQHAEPEHLRRLRLPQAVARFRARDAPFRVRVAFGFDALQRIRNRQRQNAADRVVLQFADELCGSSPA